MDVYLIVDPAAHRVAEAGAIERGEAEDVPDGWIRIVMPIPLADDWTCDYCNATIDLDDGPIVSVNEHALCHGCASTALRSSRHVRVGGDIILPVCPCRGCTPHR